MTAGSVYHQPPSREWDYCLTRNIGQNEYGHKWPLPVPTELVSFVLT